jgi:hypothetical protein
MLLPQVFILIFKNFTSRNQKKAPPPVYSPLIPPKKGRKHTEKMGKVFLIIILSIFDKELKV